MQEIFDSNGNYQGMKTTDLLGNDILVDAKGEYKGIFMKDLFGNNTFMDNKGQTTVFTKDIFGNNAAWGPGEAKGIITKDLLGNTVFRGDQGDFLIRDLFPWTKRRSESPSMTPTESVPQPQQAHSTAVTPPDAGDTPHVSITPGPGTAAGVASSIRPSSDSESQAGAGTDLSSPASERELISSQKLTDRFKSQVGSPATAAMSPENLRRYASFVAEVLQKCGYAFDMKAENVRYVDRIKPDGFLGLKKKRTRERTVDASWQCWLMERIDNIYSDGPARIEENVYFILTADGTMMQGTEREVIAGDHRKLTPPVWEPCDFPSAEMLDLCLRMKGSNFDSTVFLTAPRWKLMDGTDESAGADRK